MMICTAYSRHNQDTVKNLSKTASQKDQNCFQDKLSLNAGQKYCRMLKGEHSATLSTFIKLAFVIKICVLFILCGCFAQILL